MFQELLIYFWDNYKKFYGLFLSFFFWIIWIMASPTSGQIIERTELHTSDTTNGSPIKDALFGLNALLWIPERQSPAEVKA